jgi:hypothetical protein
MQLVKNIATPVAPTFVLVYYTRRGASCQIGDFCHNATGAFPIVSRSRLGAVLTQGIDLPKILKYIPLPHGISLFCPCWFQK